MVPFVGYHFIFWVWSIDEYVVFLISTSVLHFLNFFPDGLHHFHEIVEFPQAFTFGRLDHQCTVYREGEGRCMITEVHQTLRNIVFANAAHVVQVTAIENHFVTYKTGCTRVNDTVSISQASGQIVCTQDSGLGSTCQAFSTHHADVTVSNRENTGATIRSCRYLIGFITEHEVTRQERNEVFGHTDRTYARTTTTVRAGKCLVEVQVANVCTDSTRIGQTYLSIHVGTVHVHLCTASMDNFTNLLDFRFEDTVSRRISNHESRQVVLVGFCLRTEVFYIHITLFIACTSYGSETALYGRCRVGTVSRRRNQDLVTMTLTDAFQISTDDTETGVFTSRT